MHKVVLVYLTENGLQWDKETSTIKVELFAPPVSALEAFM